MKFFDHNLKLFDVKEIVMKGERKAQMTTIARTLQPIMKFFVQNVELLEMIEVKMFGKSKQAQMTQI